MGSTPTPQLFWFNNLTSEGSTDRTRICLHCETEGWVMLDPNNGMIPCPICRLGAHVDTGSKDTANLTFWQRNYKHIQEMTWNNGMNIYQVGKCAKGCTRPLAPTETCPNHQEETK